MMIRTMAAVSLTALLMSGGAYAASDYLLQLDTVKGESRAAPGGGGSGGQIEVQSFSWGASNSGAMSSGGGMGQGRMASPAAPPAGPGSVVVTVSGAASCARGKHFPTAILSARTASSYTLEDVTITECSVHGDPHVLEMSYGKVSVSDLSVMSGPRNKGMAPPPATEMAPAPAMSK